MPSNLPIGKIYQAYVALRFLWERVQVNLLSSSDEEILAILQHGKRVVAVHAEDEKDHESK